MNKATAKRYFRLFLHGFTAGLLVGGVFGVVFLATLTTNTH